MASISLDNINVHLIGNNNLSASEDCCVYLVSNSKSSILIDAGAGSTKSIKNIIQNIITIEPIENIKFIIVTHAHIDHVGGLKAIKSHLLDTKIIAHEYAARVISEEDSILSAAHWYQTKLHSVNIDIKISSSYEIQLLGGSFRVIHCPGHTPGSVVGLLISETTGERILFGQDIHGPFMPEWGSDISQWRSSMQEILDLQPDYLCEGHFGIIKGKIEVKQFIEKYLRQFS
jgi:glyoxylase-like metal-dependent hydrolase (beta-lactamase superfamily II)